MTKRYTRRDALRFGALGLASGGLNAMLGRRVPASFARARAGQAPPKLLVVFMRGGYDGLAAVFPSGPVANAHPIGGGGGKTPKQQLIEARPDIFIPNAQSIALTGFAEMHPTLQPLHAAFLAGDVAFLHQVGSDHLDKSHFSSQDYWESSGVAGEGIVPRLVEQGALATSGFGGASVSGQMQLLFNTREPSRVLAHVPKIEAGTMPDKAAYSLYLNKFVSTARERKLRDHLALASAHPTLQGQNDLLLRENMAEMVSSQNQVSPLTPSGTGFPSSTLGEQLRDAVALLELTSCVVAGVEVGGFDTHQKQVDPTSPTTGIYADRVGGVAAALKAVYDAAKASTAMDLVTLVVSEFGRRVGQNGTLGTDHGEGNLVFAIGSSVNGGVYNCDGSTWPGPGGPLDPGTGPYTSISLPFRTDFRHVFAELFGAHFGITSTALIENILPGYTADKAADPAKFADLGFI